MTGMGVRTRFLLALLGLVALGALGPSREAGAEAVVHFEAGTLKNPVRVGEAVVFGGTFHVEGVPAGQVAAWPARIRWTIRMAHAPGALARGEVRIDRSDLPFTAQVRAERPGRYLFELHPAVSGDGYRYRLPGPLVVEAKGGTGGTLPTVGFRPAAVPESIASGRSVNFGGVLEVNDPGLLDRLKKQRIFIDWKVVRAEDGQVVDTGRVQLQGERTLLLVSIRPPAPGRYRLVLQPPRGAPYRFVPSGSMPVVEVRKEAMP